MTSMVGAVGLKGKRCLVLGAGGFIGTNLVRRLTALGAQVTGFGRLPVFPAALTDVEFIEGDFTETATLVPLIADAEVVFHLISTTTPTTSDRDPAADVSANVVGTIRLLDLMRNAGRRKIVFLSSGGTVYGRSAPVPTPEDYCADPICSYGITRKTIENYLSLYCFHHGLDYTVLRVANPYGPYQVARGQGVIATIIERALKNELIEIWGDGTVERDFVYIDDVVDAICRAASVSDDAPRIFNVGSGRSCSIRNVINAVSALHPQPLNIAYLAGRMIDVTKSSLDINRANIFLGWKPATNLEAGLPSTYAWMQDWLA